jgi:hypothetical protein
MKLIKTTVIGFLFTLLIGIASLTASSANANGKLTVVGETTLVKNGTSSPLGVQRRIEHSRIASAALYDQANCKPLHMYSNGVVGDLESGIMGDRLSIGGGAHGRSG